MAEFLLELFSEEIPARMQAKAGEDLQAFFTAQLAANDLTVKSIVHHTTPRRLTLVADGLPASRPEKSEERKGPRVGSPDQAIQGFLKSTGLKKIEDAEVRKTDKGDFYFCQMKQPAMPVADILPGIVQKLVAEFDWPKSMRWGGSQKTWVRPLRSVCAVLDDKSLVGSVDFTNGVQVTFGSNTLGHRFMSDGKPFAVKNFADYQKKLESACVVLSREARKEKIKAGLEAAAKKLSLTVRDDIGLLEEVVGLVEWPVVLVGTIDAEFMSVPDRVLITSMRQHQKYFSLLNKDGTLANKFAFVANIDAKDGGKTIIAGNERVLRARLSDAKFFWDQDRKTRLEDRLPKLKDIVFHAKLGTIGQKATRLSNITRALADKTGANPVEALDAALLCKADLVTGMVGEFPELQGYMGGEYLKAEGESTAIADAIANHYRPLGPADEIPKQPLSIALALADKIDTLVGFFMVGEKPTGSKDPFALRRACLGIIRIILENNVSLNLRPLIGLVYQNYAEQLEDIKLGEEKLCDEVIEFFDDRLKVYLKDKDIRHDVVASVLSLDGESDLRKTVQRAEAVQKYLSATEGQQLLAAYRRAANIVKAEAAKDKRDYGAAADSRLLQQPAEIKVFEILQKNYAPAERLIEQGKFGEAIQTLSQLRAPLDEFFDNVKVNAEDPEIRDNRLRLLNQIRATIDTIADFSKIEG
ncbi:MAG: glycine--tRNA ligase subunit beta [Alphaproteobacteria bacterium]|nr:MAG: glycine--tRNA ligase subunit beta [Alphaproteobacteria bacterium]